MIFHLTLNKSATASIIPINYQYPLSAAIYKILQKGNKEYAQFLHEEGYGKGYKFFTFSDLKGKFKRDGDRLILLEDSMQLKVCFHLPLASQVFVEGLFRSETIEIADKKSKSSFTVQSIIAETPPLNEIENEKEIIQIKLKPESAIVAGPKKEDGNYDFKAPDEEGFTESLIYSWREKIKAAYNEKTGRDAMLSIEVEKYENPYRSRLIHIKAGTTEETKIRGFLNFKLKLTAEQRFLDLILNAGLGLYSAQGMGCVGVIEEHINKNEK